MVRTSTEFKRLARLRCVVTSQVTPHDLLFYTTPAYQCNYLPGQRANTLFADPDRANSTTVYSVLARYGFRRSGEHLYRPHCRRCHACVPVRIPVVEFQPRRNQQRTWRQNQDLTVIALPAAYRREHYDLYQKYLLARHKGGGMDNPSPESYMEFLTASWMETIFYEMRLDDRLVGIAVADRLDDALSAVYSFFDPDYSYRSLGRFAIMLQVREATQQGFKWLYLGYWIRECRKMEYKDQYQPLEYYQDGSWWRKPQQVARRQSNAG